MLTLVATVIFAGVFALFATQNTSSALVNIGTASVNIPLYLTVLIPLVIGLLVAYFIYVAYTLSLRLTLNEQKDEIKKLKNENAALIKETHKIELENARLKNSKVKPVDEEAF